MVSREAGQLWPLFPTAALHRSRASESAVSASPTSTVRGSPAPMSASTSTIRPSEAVRPRAYLPRRRAEPRGWPTRSPVVAHRVMGQGVLAVDGVGAALVTVDVVGDGDER